MCGSGESTLCVLCVCGDDLGVCCRRVVRGGGGAASASSGLLEDCIGSCQVYDGKGVLLGTPSTVQH